MAMNEADALEYTESIEQIGEGWFRQLALGIKLRVPEALRLTRRDWSDRIGLKIRNRAERLQIVLELHTEGLTNRAIADVLGVGKDTVNRDLDGAFAPPIDDEQEEEEDESGAFAPPIDDEPAQEDGDEDDAKILAEEATWQMSLSNMAKEAISLPEYWDAEFGNWRSFNASSLTISLARKAAATWSEIAASMSINDGEKDE